MYIGKSAISLIYYHQRRTIMELLVGWWGHKNTCRCLISITTRRGREIRRDVWLDRCVCVCLCLHIQGAQLGFRTQLDRCNVLHEYYAERVKLPTSAFDTFFFFFFFGSLSFSIVLFSSRSWLISLQGVCRLMDVPNFSCQVIASASRLERLWRAREYRMWETSKNEARKKN